MREEEGMCRKWALEVQLSSDRHGAISGVFMLETTPSHLSVTHLGARFQKGNETLVVDLSHLKTARLRHIC
jgi:hypothetical protein